MNKCVLEANIRRIRLMRVALMSIGFPVPTLLAFYGENGVSVQQGLCLQAFFGIVFALFEVPCGYIADLLSRKRTLIFGAVTLLLAATVYGLGQGFWHFLVAEALYALALALISGADEALLYDSLLSAGEEERHSPLWSRITQWEFVTAAVVFAIGGLFALFSTRLVFLLPVLGFSAYFMLARSLVEPERKRLNTNKGHCQTLIAVARFCLVEQASLRMIFAYSAIMLASMQISFWLCQPWLQMQGVPLWVNGLVFGAFNLAAGLFAGQAHKVQERFGDGKCFALALMIQVTSLVLVAIWNQPIAIMLLVFQQFNRALLRVVIADAIQKVAPSEFRTTVLSLRGLSDRVAYACLLFPFSMGLERTSAQHAFALLGLLTMLGGALLVVTIACGRRRMRKLALREV